MKNSDEELQPSTFKINREVALPLVLVAKFNETYHPDGMIRKNDLILNAIEDICNNIINDPENFFIGIEVIYPEGLKKKVKSSKIGIDLTDEENLVSYQVFFNARVKALFQKARKVLISHGKDINLRSMVYLAMHNFNKTALVNMIKELAEAYSIDIEIKTKDEDEVHKLINDMTRLKSRLDEIKSRHK